MAHYTPMQMQQMFKQTLTIFANNFLNQNKFINSLEFKNYIHEKIKKEDLPNEEFTQQQSSEFLKEYSGNKQLLTHRHRNGYNIYYPANLADELEDYLAKDNKPYTMTGKVCYNRANPQQFICGPVRKVIRKQVKKMYDIPYNQVNTCSAEYYKKHFMQK